METLGPGSVESYLIQAGEILIGKGSGAQLGFSGLHLSQSAMVANLLLDASWHAPLFDFLCLEFINSIAGIAEALDCEFATQSLVAILKGPRCIWVGIQASSQIDT